MLVVSCTIPFICKFLFFFWWFSIAGRDGMVALYHGLDEMGDGCQGGVGIRIRHRDSVHGLSTACDL